MANKKGMTTFEKDIYSLAGSVGLLVGNALGGFIPFGNLIPMALTSITGGITLDNLLNNKWEKVFNKLSICNSDGIYPKQLHEFKSETETKYIFKMPNRLTVGNLMNCQDAIETYLHKSIRIVETKNFYAEITVFDKPNLSCLWYKIFKACGFKNKEGDYPVYLGSEETQIGFKHIFKLPLGMCIEMFENAKPLIISAINKPVKLNLTPDNKLIIQEYQIEYSSFYSPKYSLKHNTKDTSKVTYTDLTKDKYQDLVFPIGITLTPEGEKIVYIDLIDEPNILVAGTNGSGKSSFIKNLITAMILQNIEIKIFDLKFSGDYNVFRNYKHLTTFITDLNVARNELNKIKQAMDERYKKLNQTNCKNYLVYNHKFKDDQMKPVVVVIEEYYMLNAKQYKATDILNPILSKCRACNIKFIIILQRPCKDNLDPVLKANLNHVVGFRVVSIPNSEVVLGEGDKRLYTDLSGKGTAIIHDMYQDIQFKSFFLEDDEESNQTSKVKYGIYFDITIEQIIAHKNKPIQVEKPIVQKTQIKENIPDKTIPIETIKPTKNIEGKVIPFHVNQNTVKRT